MGNTQCTFTLFSTHCEFCDGNELNRFTCGGALAPHNECRQRLGDIRHSLRTIKGVKGVHARHLHYVLPAVSSVDLEDEEAAAARERAARTSWLGGRSRRSDGMLGKGHRRVPWCPRCGREFTMMRKSARGLRFGATSLQSELRRKRSKSGRRGSAAALGVPVYARELGRTESPYTVVDSLEKESWMSLAAKGAQREKDGDDDDGGGGRDSDRDDTAGALGGGNAGDGGDSDGGNSEEDTDGEGEIYLTESHGSKLPEWNDDIGSLVLSFQEHRVLKSSAKNFLLVTGGKENSKKEPPRPRAGTAEAAAAAAREERREKRRKERRRHRSRYDSDSDEDEDEDGLEEERATIQFGKAKAGRYNLDFRYPICPLQAFGVALSTFAWKLEADK